MSSEYKYYSIILKACSNRENLGLILEKTLLRGRLAIKMALDNIPSVIIYKGNTDNIIPVFDIFAAEYAAITVLPDGVPPALPISKKYRDFSAINPETQKLLSTAPDNLWLGEAIHRVVPANFLDETGALVISSHAVYFIDRPAGDSQCRWLIISYNQSLTIDTHESSLTINYTDSSGQQTDVFTLPAELLSPVQKSLQQAIAAKRYLTTIKSSCPTCNHTSEDILGHSSFHSQCPNCGKPIQRAILS